MIFKSNEFNGYKIPKILVETTNFNTTSYREFDIINSFLRGKILSVNVGKSSDNMAYYALRVTGMIGSVDEDLRYYSDGYFICGKWKKVIDPNDFIQNKISFHELKDDFIGFISGMNGSVGATIYAQLHPEKVLM